MKRFSFKEFTKKHYVLKEAAVATIFTIIVTFLISFIPMRAEFIKAVKQGFLGFDIYDIYFSDRHLPNLQRDSNIVIVEIGEDRGTIADQLNIINKYSPAVIGIDADFGEGDDHFGNIKLLQTINQLGNVLYLGFDAGLINGDDTLRFEPVYNQQAGCGHINYVEKDSFSVIREYTPFLTIDKSVYPALTSAIVEKYDPGKFQKLKRRRNKTEVINYTGNLESYTSLSAQELIYADSTQQLENIIKGKIVLLGYFVKDTPPVIKDLFFSPVNKQVSGKSFPDMYGVVIHANILTMVLNGSYINQPSAFVSYLYATLIIFLFLFYMLIQYKERGHPKHGKFMLIQFLLILLVLYLFLQVFNLFQVKMPLLPIMIALVLCLELLGVYKNIALWMHKKYEYRTVFAHKHII